jgi:hypothetical protein
MLKKLFGGKGNYYLQLDESGESKATETATVSETPESSEAPTAVAEASPSVETETPAAPPAPAPKTKSIKSKPKSAAAVPAPAPASQVLDSKELAKQAIAKTSSQKAAAQEGPKGFASDYLMPLPTARRMPGPSLNAFKEMARQAKVPNK